MGRTEQLISALSKNEKAYFKRWVPNSEKEKKFVTVFELIAKKPAVTTPELLTMLGADVSPKKLETLKTHLRSSLLLSLRDYHRKNDFQLEFNSRSDAVKVLRLKGLLDDALKMAEGLLKDCEEIEMLPEALRAIEHMENIYTLQAETNAAIWKQIYEKKQTLALQIAESSLVRSFERRLKLLNDDLGQTLNIDRHRTLVMNLSEEIGNAGIPQTANFDAHFRYYQTQAIIARILQRKDEERTCFRKVFLLLENNPKMTQTYLSSFYFVSLHNYFDALLTAQELEEIPSLLDRMEQWLEDNAGLKKDFYCHFANDMLAYQIAKQDYVLGIEKWSGFEQTRKVYPADGTETHVRYMTLGSALYFWNKEYRKALSVLRAMFKELQPSEATELLSVARCMEILCNYELGDDTHAEHLIGVLMRRLATTSDNLSMEACVIRAVLKELKGTEQASENWKGLVSELESILKDPDEAAKLLTFDFLTYARQKI